MTSDTSFRYRQAEMFMQGVLSTKLVVNDAVFAHWIKDSNCFWYQRDKSNGKEYRLVDASEGTNTLAFDHALLAKALFKSTGVALDPENLPIKQVEINLLPPQIDFHAFNKPWTYKPNDTLCFIREEQNTSGGLHSPDGQNSIFVRDHNVWIRNLVNGEERALTQDGTQDNPYGHSPLATEIQALWSPDSKRILAIQLDLSMVSERPLLNSIPANIPDSKSNVRPTSMAHKMSWPGDENIETYRLIAIDVDTGDIQQANYQQLPFFRFGEGFFTDEKLGWWAKDSHLAYFVDVTRGAKIVRVVEFNTTSGDTRVLIEETSDTRVKLCHSVNEYPIFTPLPESDELIWFSERSGWAHLYLYDLKSAKLKHSITEGQWLVRNILHVNASKREIVLQSAVRDKSISPYFRDICRVNIDSRELVTLAGGNNEHFVYGLKDNQVTTRAAAGIDSANVTGVSPCGEYIVTTRSRVDTAPVSMLIDRSGKEILKLETTETSCLPVDWEWPEPVKVKSADGKTDIYGVIYRPPGFSIDESYPILDFSCGHAGYTFVPQGSFINGPSFDLPYLSGAAYAALGFVVVALEGRGTPYRHKDFQDYSYGNMASASALEDRVEGIRQLAELYPYMDIARIGIISSDGISGPVHALLKYADFYKVGVALGLEDSRYAYTAMVEQLEGLSIHQNIESQSQDNYAETYAQNLKGKLLLIHGLLDTVTPVTGTLRLVDALQQENKEFDMLILPNDGHDASTYALRRSWDYLVTHLQESKPPNEYKLITGIDLLMASLK